MTVVRWVGVALALALGCEPATTRTRHADGCCRPETKCYAAVSPGFSAGTGDAAATTTELELTEGCDDAAKLVYVLSLEGDLYSFAPADKKFTKLGAIDCGSNFTNWSTISMAVDRNAVAWVNLRSDTDDTLGNVLVKYDINKKTCTPTQINGAIGGMAFSTNGGGAMQTRRST